MPVFVLACLIAPYESMESMEMKSDAYLLPEQSFPRRESCCFEQGVLENGLDTTKGLDDISTVSVEVP